MIEANDGQHDGKTRWQYCLGIVKTWADHLEMDECVLIVFSDAVRVYPERPGGARGFFATGSKAGRAQLAASLDALKTPEGATNTPDAIRAALAIPDVGCVILFTDGKPDRRGPDGAAIPTETLQGEVYALIARSRKVPINTVGLGDYFKPELSSFLMRVSELTGGVFIGR